MKNNISEGSRGLKRTERVVGALRAKQTTETGTELRSRGAAFKLRQTAAGGEETGGLRRDPTQEPGKPRQAGMQPIANPRTGNPDPQRGVSGRQRIGDRTYVSPKYQTGSDVARQQNPTQTPAINRTDQRVREVAANISRDASVHQQKLANIEAERAATTPSARQKVSNMAGRVAAAVSRVFN